MIKNRIRATLAATAVAAAGLVGLPSTAEAADTSYIRVCFLHPSGLPFAYGTHVVWWSGSAERYYYGASATASGCTTYPVVTGWYYRVEPDGPKYRGSSNWIRATQAGYIYQGGTYRTTAAY